MYMNIHQNQCDHLSYATNVPYMHNVIKCNYKNKHETVCDHQQLEKNRSINPLIV